MSHTPRLVLALTTVLFAALPACSSSADSSSGDPPATTDATYSAGPFHIESGQDETFCTYVRGENEADEDVVRFDSQQSAGGHHLIVYTIDHDVDLPPAPCSQGGQPSWNQILVTQVQKDSFAFPEGVGFHVKAHQQYVMETHFINTTTDALDVTTSFSMKYAATGEAKERAASYFFGTMNIDIEPQSKAHQEAVCSPPEPMTLHTMFGHQHRLGTGVSVDFLADGGSPKNLYQTDDWDSPPTKQFDGDGLQLGTNDALKVSCDWQNTGTDRVRYPHEMCFAIGYFWPAEYGIDCLTGGQQDTCQCRKQGDIDVGPGGSEVDVKVNRKDGVIGKAGEVDEGAPIYCALYRAEDVNGPLPKPGAEPLYFRDQHDVPLKTSTDTADFQISDVSPGDYAVICMMDAIGGGFIQGTGDLVSIKSNKVTAVKGETADIDVTLDFALP